jgi:hypothetical protein
LCRHRPWQENHHAPHCHHKTASDWTVWLMPSYVRGRPTQRLISDQEILRLYVEEELDGDTISYRSGCSSTTVLEIIRKLGGVVRERGGRCERKTLKLTDAEIIQRYNDGASGLTLAEQAGCDHTTIYRLLHSHGVRTRTPTESGVAARARDRLDKSKN